MSNQDIFVKIYLIFIFLLLILYFIFSVLEELVDNETHFVEEFETEFSIGFEDFEGSYSDFVEYEKD